MNTMKLILTFITGVFVFGTSIGYASYTSYTVDGTTALSPSHKANIAESIRQKIKALNARNYGAVNNFATGNEPYYPANTNSLDTTIVDDNYEGYYTVNGAYNPSLHYVILQPNGTLPRRTVSYGLQKDSRLNSMNYIGGTRIPYINVDNKYNVNGSNLSPEINRFILNKERGYSLQEQVSLNSYYNYFFTYSNNDYNKRYITNTTDLRYYIEDLVERDRDRLDIIENEVRNDISLIRSALDSYGSSIYTIGKKESYENKVLKDMLMKLKKVKKQINEDRHTLKYVLRNY